MYDWFVAELRCPECGTVNPATSGTNMQTHLCDDADGSELGVGTPLDPQDVRPDDILSSGYQLVSQPEPGRCVRLLEEWECPSCGKTGNWAVITIRAGDDARIEAIEAVTLDRATLERAHFISDAAQIVAARVSGVPFAEVSSGNCIELLREHLP